MRIVRQIDELRSAAAELPGLALVPTMGNLHDGHVALMHLARGRARHLAVSIFVNRLQFAPGEDFDSYPRSFEADCTRLRGASVDLLFAPDEGVLYPEPQAFVIEPPAIAGELEGRFRPRFFNGVATVVLKLFNCVQPRVAVFGKKDYQQLHLIRGMARQLNLPVEILAGETVRESDGLAMSSRNGYLSAAERAEAPRLQRVLQKVRDGMACEAAVEELAAAGWKPDYVEVRRRRDLALPESGENEVVVLAAARLGGTRLIDNLEF